MTIAQAIAKINALKPNSYSDEEKIGWLSELDKRINEEIINTHEGSEKVVFDGYTANTSHTTQLLVPAPHDDLYVYWMESKIDYWNGETNKFNNSISMFNATYSEYARHYNRTNMPKGRNLKFF